MCNPMKTLEDVLEEMQVLQYIEKETTDGFKSAMEDLTERDRDSCVPADQSFQITEMHTCGSYVRTF